MTRENMFTKIVAWLICAVMIIGMIPNVSLPAAATNGWEGEIDELEEGEKGKPATAALGDNEAPESKTDYYWTYTEDHDCIMVLTSAADITVNGTVYAVEDGANEVVVELSVKEEDVISICSLSFNLSYKSGACATHAIFLGSMENTVTNEGTVYYMGYFSGTTMTVTGEGDFEVDYNGETIIAVDGVVSTPVSTSNPRMPVEFSITGDGNFTISFVYPEGSSNNPLIAVLGDNVASVEANNTQGFYMTYVADYTGTLLVEISGVDGWTYVINNMTTYAYGETQWSDSEPVVNPAEIAVTAGDEIQIIVNTYNAEDMWNTPAGEITVNLSYKAGSCPEYAIFLGSMENSVTNEGTVYYMGYFSGTTMTVTGEGDFEVVYNGETIIAVDGVVSTPVSTSNPRMPVEFSVIGDGNFTISFAYPEGSSNNPLIAVLGDNVASVEANNTQGFYMTYVADYTGTLLVEISGVDGWSYVINNMTTYAYGETQWSDSDPVINPAEIAVTEGDEIQIIVNTYNADDMWNTPAGDITVNLAYAEEGPIVADDLTFTQIGLSFQEFIGIQPVMRNAVATSYDEVYIEVVHEAWSKDEAGFVTTTENITGARYGTTSYYRFTKKIMAWSMAESVTITLYGVKGDDLYIGESVQTSVEQLALEKLATYETAGNTKACTALANMLTYGAKLQLVQSFNTGNLADANLGDFSAYVTTTVPTVDATNDTGTATSVKVNVNNVSMQAQVEIQLAFKQTTDLTGYELRYTVNGETSTMDVEDFSVLSGYNFAKIAIKASNMREVYTIALYDIETGEPVTAVLNVSVEGYCTKKLETADEANTALIYALINYGDAIAAL